MKAYKFKLKPNKQFVQNCENTLDLCRELYNAALQERSEAYKLCKVSINFHKQAMQLPEIKNVREDLDGIHSQVTQDVLRRLSKAFDNFFQRCFKGEKPGYPRFKNKVRYNSFTYPQSGFKLVGNKLTLSKLGSCRVRLSQPITGKIKTCTIKKQVDGWFVVFTTEEVITRFVPKTSQVIGIDLGLETFATLSNGEPIENPRYLRKAEEAIKIQQRKKDNKKHKSSNRRKAAILLAKKHLKVANQRKDFFYKLSNDLIAKFDSIVVEDLNIKGMLKNHHLAKSISDASWGTFISIFTHKAESAGRKVYKVDPTFTSQDCSECGNRVKKSLSQREHRCITCGLVLHRDHNAAINVLGRADLLVFSNQESPLFT